MAKKCFKMPKVVQLDSTMLVLLKYENNIFSYPLQANIWLKIGRKSIFPYKTPICSKSRKKHQLNKKNGPIDLKFGLKS